MVIHTRRLLVRIDMTIVQDQFTMLDAGKSFMKLSMTTAQAFHFAADQYHPALDLMSDEIIVQCPAIGDSRWLVVLFTPGHDGMID